MAALLFIFSNVADRNLLRTAHLKAMAGVGATAHRKTIFPSHKVHGRSIGQACPQHCFGIGQRQLSKRQLCQQALIVGHIRSRVFFVCRHVGHAGNQLACSRFSNMRNRSKSGVLLPAYELFTNTELLLGRMAMERMLAGVSTRRYPVALEPVGEQVEADGKSTGRSAVSRRFVAMTETALADLLAADLSGLDLVAIMIDGVHFADHLCVVALGIGLDGVKHPLAVVEGSTENTTLVRGLLVGLRDRGLDVTRPILAVLDGAKALSAAVKEVFDHPVIGRCQLHKVRNVQDDLPEKLRGLVGQRMRSAYHAYSALAAQALLGALAAELDKTHPGAGGQSPGGVGRDVDRAPGLGAAHPGPHPAQHERGRVDDLDQPRPLPQRETLARRADGTALVRRRHRRSRQAVPPRQRTPPPARPPDRPRPTGRRRNCHQHLR